MPKKLNLLNQRFGRLTVIAPAKNKGKHTCWLCECDCGNEYIALTDSLRAGTCQSCGCLRAEQARINGKTQLKDLTGQKFGKLTVISYAGSSRHRSSWLCECDCGNIVVVNQMELTRKDTLSCGCLKSSFAELQIEKILKENNIQYKKEYSFNDLKSENNIPLRFDFAIFNTDNSIKCLIEYDGEQYFLKKTEKIWWSDSLEQRRKRDNIKNKYCLKHSIPLYRIPYWEKNNLDLNLIFNDKYLIKS